MKAPNGWPGGMHLTTCKEKGLARRYGVDAGNPTAM